LLRKEIKKMKKKHVKLYESFLNDFNTETLKLTKFEFETFRNDLYDYLVKENIIEDNDDLYSDIDEWLGKGDYIEIDWEDEWNPKDGSIPEVEHNEIDKDIFVVYLSDFIKEFDLIEYKDKIINYILENTFLNIV
jgi:hypothetical protein